MCRKALDFWLSLLISTLIILERVTKTSLQGTDRCILNFTQQPATSVDCNVYDSNLEVLICIVESIDTAEVVDVQDISVKWFFFNDTEYELTIGTNPVQRTGGNGAHLKVNSTLYISGTSQPGASFVSEGYYYCRVHMFDADIQLHPSQRFEVFSSDRYLQLSSSCNDQTFTVASESCAASRLSSDTSTTSATLPGGTTAITNVLSERDTTARPTTTTNTTSPISNNNETSGNKVAVWIYILAALGVAFVIIINVIQVAVCLWIGLRHSKSQTLSKNVENYESHTYETVESITEARTVGTLVEVNPAYSSARSGDINNIELESCAAYEIVKA